MDTLSNIAMIIFASLAYATPIIFAGIGGLYSERSGVVNVALEGMMVIGACTAGLISYYFGAMLGGPLMILVTFVISGVVGGLFALLHAVASVSFKANQVISGTALNMLSLALTSFIVKLLFSGVEETPGSSVLYSLDIPLGIYALNWTFLIVVGIVALTGFMLTNTKLGLRLRAVGENPSAVDTAGISVTRLRYGAVILSGVLAAIGGAIVVLTFTSGKFQPATISGLGFLGLAALIFGKWQAWGVFGAALFFGFCQSFANIAGFYFPAINEMVPDYMLKILPYVFTIVALVLFSRHAVAPKAVGVPYDKGAR